MDDSIHILLALTLTWVYTKLEKRGSLGEYLVSLLAVVFPMSDHYLIGPLVGLGYLPESPVWLHRSVTHSILAFVAVVTFFTLLSREYFAPLLIGYASHIVPDLFYGKVKLLLPFSSAGYGLTLPAPLGLAVQGPWASRSR